MSGSSLNGEPDEDEGPDDKTADDLFQELAETESSLGTSADGDEIYEELTDDSPEEIIAAADETVEEHPVDDAILPDEDALQELLLSDRTMEDGFLWIDTGGETETDDEDPFADDVVDEWSDAFAEASEETLSTDDERPPHDEVPGDLTWSTDDADASGKADDSESVDTGDAGDTDDADDATPSDDSDPGITIEVPDPEEVPGATADADTESDIDDESDTDDTSAAPSETLDEAEEGPEGSETPEDPKPDWVSDAAETTDPEPPEETSDAEEAASDDGDDLSDTEESTGDDGGETATDDGPERRIFDTDPDETAPSSSVGSGAEDDGDEGDESATDEEETADEDASSGLVSRLLALLPF